MKRRLLIAVIFLLAGAVVNVAVAWGCAVWTIRGRGASALVFFMPEGRVHPDPPWLRESDWKLRLEDDDFVLETTSREISGFGLERQGFLLYTDVKPGQRGALSAATIVVRDRSGWPLRALQGEQWLLKSEDYPDVPARRWFFESRFAIAKVRVIDSWKGRMIKDDRLLAYLPIWPGFAVNTLFYATLLWVLISGPFALRRLIRRRRGRCPDCGYDLHQLEDEACPECGLAA